MVWYEMVWYAMLFVSTHVVNIMDITHHFFISLGMFQHFDTWSCHHSFQVQPTTHLTGEFVKICKWHSTVAYRSAVQYFERKQSQTIKHAIMSLKRDWQETNFINSEHTKQNDTKLCCLAQRCWICWICCAGCSTHSDSLWCFFSVWIGTDNTPTSTPTSPAWKNMPMMAIIASLPFAISALSFFVFSAGSAAVNTLNPKSPAYASVPGVCSWETSQKAM